ncbi:MAG: ABC transporter substrate-binding protein [Rhodobacter sp.]|nr:ABC transporter substrate-binding protein [Paracoccaceae bacterium]MCC0075136.1 ABC transporter substrate-binding protein [Rhodobacter sp.]
MRLTLNRRSFLATGAAASTLPFLPRAARASSPFAMQAAWINDAEFAGYFLAMDKGYYAEEGLDLTYLSGGPDVIPESTIVAGRADLALTTPDTTIKAIAEQGAPFKIIGTQYQKNPIGIVSLASNPVLSPADMVGKTIAVPPVNTVSVEAVLAMNGIDRASVNIVPYAYDPTPLIRGEIDASLDFTTNVPYTISMMGAEAVSFLLYDFGYTIYNDTVVVTEETLATKRAELIAWLRASRRGWAENLADPALYPPQWAETHFAGTGREIENEVFFNTAQKPLIESPAGIFAMTEEGIAGNLEALAAVGIHGTRAMFDTTLLEEV